MEEITKSFASISDKVMAWIDAAIRSLPNLLVAIILVATFWFIAGWIYSFVERVFRRTDLNSNLEHLIAKTVKICVLLLGFILALSVLKLDKAVFSLLAGVGVIGLALGFAFQDLVSNFVAGLMIAVRSPFRVGDIVEVEKTNGTIVEIRLRDTVVKNFSGQHVLIPNKTFMTEEIINYSTNGKRRVEISVGISYDASLRVAKKSTYDAVVAIDGVLSDPVPEVLVQELGASSVNLMVYFWVKFPGSNYGAIKEEAIISIKEALDAKNIGLPSPIRTLDFSPATIGRIHDAFKIGDVRGASPASGEPKRPIGH